MIFQNLLAATTGGAGEFFGGPVFMIIILIVMMYVLMIRPQQRQRKEQEARIAALRKGDKVVTIGGMHAVVHHISDRTVTLKLAEGVFVPFDKASIRDVGGKRKPGESPAKEDDSEEPEVSADAQSK